MRKGATVFLAVVLLSALAMGGADAWVRSKMYDGNLPYDPLEPNPTGVMPGWHDDHKNIEIRPGEWIGTGALGRWCTRASAQANVDTKVKFTSSGGWVLDQTKVTTIIWSVYIAGDADSSTAFDRAPQIYIRLGSGGAGLPGGAVKISYDAKTGDTSPTRGWYCSSGTVNASSGVDLGGGKRGVAVEPGIWHTIRVTLDPVGGTWDVWINDQTGTADHLSGTVATDTGTTRYIQWGKVDSNPMPVNKTFYTDYVYFGQGDEVSPIGAAGISTPAVTVTPGAITDSATVTWTTDVPCNTKAYWDKDFYTWGQSQTINESTLSHTVTLTGLAKRATYSLYAEGVEQGVGTPRTWASRIIQFKTSDAVTASLGNTGFEEGNAFWPWEDCVAPQSGDFTRMGGVYDKDRKWGGEDPFIYATPRTGKAYAGSMSGFYAGRDWACLRQQVATTPGQAYVARVWFWDSFNPGSFWAYTDAVGRIGVDPTGGTDPGSLDGAGFTDAAGVLWGRWVYRPDISAGWQEASMVFRADSTVSTIFLQHHYMAHPFVWLSFDDASFAISPVAPPTTCAASKSWNLGHEVTLKDVVVTNRLESSQTSAVFGYVQDPDGKSGLRIAGNGTTWSYILGTGSEVDVNGVLDVNANNELEVRIASVNSAAAPTGAVASAVGLNNKALGGSAKAQQAGVPGSVGPSNIGLLTRVWGHVTGVANAVVDTDFIGFSVFIDDGSGRVAGQDQSVTTYPGIEVKIPLSAYMYPDSFVPGRTFVSLTGDSSIKLWDPDQNSETSNSVAKPVVIIRDSDDVDFVIP